jgi:hypothetical protein
MKVTRSTTSWCVHYRPTSQTQTDRSRCEFLCASSFATSANNERRGWLAKKKKLMIMVHRVPLRTVVSDCLHRSRKVVSVAVSFWIPNERSAQLENVPEQTNGTEQESWLEMKNALLFFGIVAFLAYAVLAATVGTNKVEFDVRSGVSVSFPYSHSGCDCSTSIRMTRQCGTGPSAESHSCSQGTTPR